MGCDVADRLRAHADGIRLRAPQARRDMREAADLIDQLQAMLAERARARPSARRNSSILRLVRGGASYREAARQAGVSKSTVAGVVYRAWHKRERTARRDSEILKLVRGGASYREVAFELGISKGTVAGVVHRAKFYRRPAPVTDTRGAEA